jgi:hypothetical protein
MLRIAPLNRHRSSIFLAFILQRIHPGCIRLRTERRATEHQKT